MFVPGNGRIMPRVHDQLWRDVRHICIDLEVVEDGLYEGSCPQSFHLVSPCGRLETLKLTKLSSIVTFEFRKMMNKLEPSENKNNALITS